MPIHRRWNRALLTGDGCFGLTPTSGVAFDPAQTAGRLVNGNRTLLAAGLGFVNTYSRSLLPLTGEPIYIELRSDEINGNQYVGLARSDFTLSNVVGQGANSVGLSLTEGIIYDGGVNVGTGPTFGTGGGDYVNFAFDPRNGNVYFGRNHAWWNSAIPGRRIRPAYTVDPTKTWYFAVSQGIWTEQLTINDAPDAPPSFYCNLHPATSGGLPQTWRFDPTKKSTALTLTWSGRRAFQTSGGSGTPRNVLSVLPVPVTGKGYVELPMSCDSFGTMTNKALGLAKTGQNLDGRLGTDGTLAIAIFGNGNVESGGVLATQASYSSTNAFTMAWDRPGANKVWFGKNGTFLTGDPAAGTGGYSLSSISGDLYIAAGMDEASIFGDEAIIGNTTFTPPAGFTPV